MRRHAGIIPPIVKPHVHGGQFPDAGYYDALPRLQQHLPSKSMQLTAFDEGTGVWVRTSTGGTVANSSIHQAGTQSISISYSAAGNVHATRTYSPALDLSAADDIVFARVHITGAASIDQLKIYASNSNFAKYAHLVTPYNMGATGLKYNGYELRDGWNTFAFHRADITFTGGVFDWSAIDKIRMYVATSADFEVIFDELSICKNDLAKGIVIFSWDDQYASQYDTVAPLLAANGWVSSSFICGNSASVDDSPKPPNASEFRNLQRGGWDIACHSYTHSGAVHGLDYLTQEQIRFQEIEPNLAYLEDHGFGSCDFMATPYGRSPAPVQDVLRQYFSFVRQATYHTGDHAYVPQNCHPLMMTPDYARCNGLWNYTTAADLTAEVDRCVANKTIALLYGHNVITTPTETHHLATQVLVDTLGYIAGLGANGPEVLSFGQYFRKYGI